MYKAVKVSSALFNLLTHVIVDLHVEDVGNEIQCILVILDFGVEAGQVEAVGQIILIDFAKIFIAARRDELFCIESAVCSYFDEKEHQV